MANQVNFYQGTWEQYKAITPDNYTFYYITDKQQLYLGVLKLTDQIDKDLSELVERIVVLEENSQNYTKIYSDTTQNWEANPDVSEKNALYIYTDYETIEGKTYPAIKIGDGLAYIRDLPFASGGHGSSQDIDQHIADTNLHIQNGERDFWNNKVRCYVAEDEKLDFNLFFTTN